MHAIFTKFFFEKMCFLEFKDRCLLCVSLSVVELVELVVELLSVVELSVVELVKSVLKLERDFFIESEFAKSFRP